MRILSFITCSIWYKRKDFTLAQKSRLDASLLLMWSSIWIMWQYSRAAQLRTVLCKLYTVPSQVMPDVVSDSFQVLGLAPHHSISVSELCMSNLDLHLHKWPWCVSSTYALHQLWLAGDTLFQPIRPYWASILPAHACSEPLHQVQMKTVLQTHYSYWALLLLCYWVYCDQ